VGQLMVVVVVVVPNDTWPVPDALASPHTAKHMHTWLPHNVTLPTQHPYMCDT
jgi:hypothetical protein